MKISLIIPVYNSAEYIDNLMNSILEQEYKDYEVVFVDDGSLDGSLSILEKYKKNNDNLKIISIENSGPGVARRIGFEQSKGELLFFIDSDDLLFNKSTLADIDEIYRETNFEILFFNVKIVESNNIKIVNGFYDRNIVSGEYNIEKISDRKIGSALWYKIFRRDKMKRSFFSDSDNFEDCYTTYKYLENCKKFYFTTEIYYVANRGNTGSLSKKNSEQKILNTEKLLCSLYQSTSFKKSLIFTITDYYLFARRTVDRWGLGKEEKREIIKKLWRLKEIVKSHKVLKLKIGLKNKLKYVYFRLKDFIYER